MVHDKTNESSGFCSPLLCQPIRVALRDLNHSARTDWLMAAVPGSRPAESSDKRAGVLAAAEISETAWNHKSSENQD